MTQQRFATQICFVSGQMVPNATPLLDGALRPAEVVLCATDAMLERAGPLLDFAARNGLRGRIFKLGGAYRFEDLQDKMLELASSFADPAAVGVNITGGTKLMTIAAQAVFGGNGFTCFYVVPETDQVLFLDTVPAALQSMQSRIGLEDYFAIHGYRILSMQRKPKLRPGLRQLCEKLFDHPDLHLGTLNYLAATAERAFSLTVRNEIPEPAWDVLSLFHDCGAISYYDDRKVVFSDEAGRRFCQGLWLEEYAMLVLKDMATDCAIQDSAASVVIASASGTRNEIDVAFLHGNTLFIVECKTANMYDQGTEAIYKIDTIKNDTGLFSKPLLLSFNPLPDFDCRRARDQRIAVFAGQALKNLDAHLKRLLAPEKENES